MSKLSSTFQGDLKPAPSPHDKQNQSSDPNGGSPSTLNGPMAGNDFMHWHEAQPTSLGIAVMDHTLDGHKPAKLETPFETDFRPGVDSSKK